MSFDPITYSAVQQLNLATQRLRSEIEVPNYEYIMTSRTITVPKNAQLTIRAMSAGGGGGANASNSQFGGSGGTVALKTLNVAAGDTLNVIIPAGGGAGSANVRTSGDAGGTLQVKRNGGTILSIPGGGGGGGAPTANPTGADWFVKSTPPTGSGGGSAMLLEGYSATGTATGYGGAGVLGNGGIYNGGGLMHGDGGSGFATIDMTVLRVPVDGHGGFSGGTSIQVSTSGITGTYGGNGGFGGGGGTAAGMLAYGGNGGFGGGGGSALGQGANARSYGGKGGFGGGGGASGDNAGSGGPGFVTLEWRYI